MLLTMMARPVTAFADNAAYIFNTDAGIAALGITKPAASAGTSLSTTTPYVVNQISMSVTHGSTDTRIWNSSGTLDLRIYKSGGSLTFAAASGYNITGITITGATTNVFSVNVGTYSNGSWSNSTTGAASVTFTATGTGKINTITVTYESTGGGDLENSDLAITNAPIELEFDMYNNAAAQTVSYTTSSTGAITITPTTSEYFSYVHDADNGTITVTPTAVTPAAQTVTISQAADDTYNAGSAEFTVYITNSAPQYTVTYKANGGTGDDIPVQYYAGDDVTVADNTFIYAGHAFTEWNTNEGGTGTSYNPEDVIESISADIDLYAQWEESDETVDVLNYAFTGISGTSYSAWSGKTGASGAVYAGRSGGDHSSIQLNSSSPNGIVSTTSGGKFTKVVVTWNSSTPNNRSVQIYGKNTAYEGSADLHNNDTRGTLLGTIVKGTSTELTISDDYNYIGIKNPGSAIYMDEVKITWVPDIPSSVATPTFNPASGEEFGNDGLDVTISCETENTTIYYTLNGETPDNESTVYTGAIHLTETTTVKAIAYDNNDNASNIATATYTYVDPNAPGTENNPYTVAQAITNTPSSGTSANVYIHGIVSAFYNTSIVGDGSNYRYYISDDGTTTGQLLVYKGKGLNNVAFSSADDLHIGDIVTIYGGLTMYSNASEIASGNYLTYWERPAVDVETPAFSVPAGGYAETQTVAITCATDGAQIYYTNDGTDPTNESFLYEEEIDIEETTTIKAIAYVGENASTVSSATYYILSDDNTYTVAEALAFETYPQNNIFVEGIVSTAPTSLISGGLLTYYISADGTTTNQLQVYKGKNLGNTEFTAQDDIQVGDAVTIFGNVKLYNSQKEFDQGNYLVTFERLATVATPTFTPEEGEYTEAQNVTIACATEGATIYYKTEENAEWAVYSEAINVTETTTIWAYAAKDGMNNSAVATATYTINIPVITASITIEPALVEATAEGGDGTLTVTYENITEILAQVYFCDAEGEAATYDWITAEINNENNVDYLIEENDGEARTAYFKVWAYDDGMNEVYSNLVTVTQAAAPATMYTVNFGLDGGTFVPNEDFDDEMVEVEAGTYTLPSATKDGYTFDGWNDGDQTYAAGESYTVSDDVEFTAIYTAIQTYTVSFSVNGTIDDELTITGSSIVLPTTSALTPAGFAISGWALEGSTVAVDDPYEPTAVVTLYALLTYIYSEESYDLVTDASDLAVGDIVVIAALNSDYAMSTTQNNNNRGQAAIVKSGNQIALSDNVCEFVLGEGSEDDSWSFYDAVNEGYIYAASSSSNWLRTETGLSANSSWTINIEENAATITAQGSNTRNVLQYNSSNSIFSCYASASQQAVCIYKKNAAPSFNIVNTITEPDASMSNYIPETTCVVVEDGAVLTFTGTNEGTAANLVVQEGGQLIHTTDVEATVQKSVSGYTNKSGDGWYLISSPVDNLPTSAVATGTYDLFAYDEKTAYWWVDHEIQGQTANHTFTTLERGKGYLYANSTDVNLNYAGTMKATNTNIKVDLSYACDDYPELKGFNLVGNPFTRNITAEDMVIGEDAVTSYYDFNADRTEFVAYQTNVNPIQPGQGFFIQATGNDQQLEFNPASSKDASDFKYISISAGDENFTDKAYIQFGYGNTLRKMTFGENTMVYVMNDDDDYAAARVEELAGTMPVHFVPIEDGFYTITVETKNIENLNYMHLIDNIKNTEIDLLVEPSYTFKASESDNADRFYLVFDFNNYTGVNENYTNDNFAHQIGDEIFVSGEGTLQVFDVLGRFVTGYNVNGDKRISTAAFNTGVYIFRMVGTEVKTQKIVIR